MSARMRAKALKRNRRLRNRKLRDRRAQEKPSDSNADQFQRLLRWFLPDGNIFAHLKRHGNTSWQPFPLVCLVLCWAWSESRNLTDAFTGAVSQTKALGWVSVSTYQGFMKALVVWTDPLLPVLWSVLHERMQQIGSRFWRIAGWVPIAFDGSRNTAPRTKSAEQALCAANYGTGVTARYRKKKSKGMRRKRNEKHKPQPQQPQLWITLMWHMGLRLPWMWKLGPSDASERAHVQELLKTGEFPKNTLFCGDAGFVGYPLWSQIIGQGQQFLVRVGANVNLLWQMDCQAQQNGQVLCWPEAAQKSGQPPLWLRLVQVKLGQTKMWMLTSVCNPEQLSERDIIRFYRLRWGIEVEFRGLKQTLDRGRLRCRNDRRLLVELHWSVLAMAVAELFALKKQLSSKRGTEKSPGADPALRSLAQTMRALRWCLMHLGDLPGAGEDLCTKLRQAVTDDYQRRSSKKARYRPRNPDKKPLGDPKVRPLTLQEQAKLHRLNPGKSAA